MINKKEIEKSIKEMIDEVMDSGGDFVSSLREGFISAVLLGESIDNATVELGFEKNAFYEVMVEEAIWQKKMIEATKLFLHKEFSKNMEEKIIDVEKHRGRG